MRDGTNKDSEQGKIKLLRLCNFGKLSFIKIHISMSKGCGRTLTGIVFSPVFSLKIWCHSQKIFFRPNKWLFLPCGLRLLVRFFISPSSSSVTVVGWPMIVH